MHTTTLLAAEEFHATWPDAIMLSIGAICLAAILITMIWRS